MVDSISYVKGFVEALVIIHCPHLSTASLSKVEGFGGRIGLPSL